MAVEAGVEGGGPTRLLVVSNRLPVTVKRNEDEAGWSYTMSSGGLVSALSGVKKLMPFLWIGWPGFDVGSEEAREQLSSELMEQHACLPVFMSDEIADLHYNGFSNSTLWPLFHYLAGEVNFDESHWDGYYRANVAFANAIKRVARPGDLIWVQDYHLMLLPALLREALADLPNIRLGFFLHVPFPSSEVYRALPVRNQILLGVLQCDLIGFHTYDYARHFLGACSRLLGLATRPTGVFFEGRLVQVGSFPIGIETEKFIAALEDPSVMQRVEELRGRFQGQKVLLGVERLDYIKGVPHKLHALDIFFEKYPQFQGRVVLLQVAVPTRSEVEEYQNLRTTVNELVGRINSKYGSFDYTPVQYIYKSIAFTELVALYRVADVCVVTSTRDGMNLVAYEYVACQKDQTGVLVLSEFAGAAQSMNGAIMINPWNINTVADALYEALTLPADTAAANEQNLLSYVQKYTASHWGQTFVAELQKIERSADTLNTQERLSWKQLNEHLGTIGGHKLLLLDIDPLIVDRKPGTVERKLLETINALSQVSPSTLLYLFSDMPRAFWLSIFEHGNVGLVCENGVFIRHPMSLRVSLCSEGGSNPTTTATALSNSSERTTAYDMEDWIQLVEPGGEDSWRGRLLPILQQQIALIPGALITDQERMLVCSFASCEREYGAWQADELARSLEKAVGMAPVRVEAKREQVLVTSAIIDRSTALRRITADIEAVGIKVKFCLCLDLDDGLLKTAQETIPEVCSIVVGRRPSSAKFFVDAVSEIAQLQV